jgi:sortase (surface protein transpeptidase)
MASSIASAAALHARSLFALNPSPNHYKENPMIGMPNIPLTSHHLIEADGVNVFYIFLPIP